MVGDPRIDAYVARQADFARPILTHIRALVHATVPEAGEAIKWGMPFFTYKDQNLCSMAAFKGHAAFGFWHDKVGRDDARQGAMGQFGKITRLSDLPSDAEIAALLRQAMALIDAGDRPRTSTKEPRAPLPVHPAFADAIAADPAAAAVWAAFPPGKVRDYCEWINDAKGDSTRNKRMAQAVEWIAQGKGRNWKYQR
ncbi:YdeI/OmpD-associated family protein [Sphingobium sp.]|uniref:YdeI/OmpD-associated family protein n=1 Tax=Sphingobium sp. TaxID=1912891 RepID=UPI0025EAAA91|nr:YdeI/OmpD-associated family protein [Sphingobium sp.]